MQSKESTDLAEENIRSNDRGISFKNNQEVRVREIYQTFYIDTNPQTAKKSIEKQPSPKAAA